MLLRISLGFLCFPARPAPDLTSVSENHKGSSTGHGIAPRVFLEALARGQPQLLSACSSTLTTEYPTFETRLAAGRAVMLLCGWAADADAVEAAAFWFTPVYERLFSKGVAKAYVAGAADLLAYIAKKLVGGRTLSLADIRRAVPPGKLARVAELAASMDPARQGKVKDTLNAAVADLATVAASRPESAAAAFDALLPLDLADTAVLERLAKAHPSPSAAAGRLGSKSARLQLATGKEGGAAGGAAKANKSKRGRSGRLAVALLSAAVQFAVAAGLTAVLVAYVGGRPDASPIVSWAGANKQPFTDLL